MYRCTFKTVTKNKTFKKERQDLFLKASGWSETFFFIFYKLISHKDIYHGGGHFYVMEEGIFNQTVV